MGSIVVADLAVLNTKHYGLKDYVDSKKNTKIIA